VHGEGTAALIAVAVLGLTAVGALRARPPARRAMLACALMVLGIYGIIALGRAPFYDQLRDLMIRADRYHYSTTAMLTVLLCVALGELGAHAPSRAVKQALLGVWVLLWVVLLAVVRPPINHFEWARRGAVAALATMDELITTAPPGDDVYIQNQLFRAVGPFVLANPENFPGWAGLFAVYHETNVVDGRHVFFVEADPRVLDKARRGIRSRPLLVDADTVPADRVRHAPEPPPRRPFTAAPASP